MTKRHTHRENIIKHAQKRARQRFKNVKITTSTFRLFVDMIQSGNSIRIAKTSRTVSVHKLLWEGKWIFVVYNKKYQLIVTLWEDENNNTQETNTVFL